MSGPNHMTYTKVLGLARQPLDILYIPGILTFSSSVVSASSYRCQAHKPSRACPSTYPPRQEQLTVFAQATVSNFMKLFREGRTVTEKGQEMHQCMMC